MLLSKLKQLINGKKNRRPAMPAGGFTLVEVLVATVVIIILVLAVYNSFISLSILAQTSRTRMAALALANERLEVVRNLTYSDVGIEGGWPAGRLLHEETINRGGTNFQVVTTIRSIDDPFDGTVGGTPNDTSPADYKLAEVEVDCDTCRSYRPVILNTTVSPKNLEINSGNGALFIKVFNANGQSVAAANVRVENLSTSTPFVVNDITNNSGELQLVDISPGNFIYKISVTKTGYSSSRTYAPGEAGLTNPVLPNATVAAGEVTQISFAIDQVSGLIVGTMDNTCQTIGSFPFKLQSEKLLGTDPTVLSYDQHKSTDSTGSLSLSNLEWGTYKFFPEGASYTIAGFLPPMPIILPPNADLSVNLILTLASDHGLLITAKDAITGLPLSNANVVVSSGGFTETQVTNRGYFSQTNWSSSGEETDGNIEVNDPIGELKLKKILGHYVSSGYLLSSVFDAGTASTTFYSISWAPASQATSTGADSVRFQLASSNEPSPETWEFVGPNGTADSYYTAAGSSISSEHNNQRYLRYKMYLSTADDNYSPIVSDIAITYGSACLPAGQVFFNGLTDSVYNISINKTGYQDFFGNASTTEAWQIFEAVLSPQ